MLGWLSALPDTLLRARPLLFALHAFALLFTNQLAAAEARVQDAERCIQPDTPPDQAHLIQGHAAAVRANSARYTGDLAGCVAYGQQVLRLLPETERLSADDRHVAYGARLPCERRCDETSAERRVVAVIAPIPRLG